MATNFDGHVLIQPQARTAFNTSGLAPQTPAQAAPHTLVLIGPANQGPNQLVAIGSIQDISLNLGIDSDLANAAALALNPASSGGANPLKVWNVNPTTQGTLSLLSAGAVAQIDATTTRYGLAANQIKVAVSAGTTTGYQVTVADDYSGQSITQNNITLNVLSIWYSGTGTSPTYTVSDSSLVLAATTSDTGGTIDFTNATTVQQLVNQIGQLTGWNATVLDPNGNDATTALFDNVTTATAVGTTSTTATPLTANVTAVVRYLNSGVQPWVTAVREAGATALATTGNWVYATGGSTGSATTTDWQNAYTALQSAEDVLWVVPVSPESTIWAMNQAHCQYMHSLGYGRSGVVGGALGTTVATALANVQALGTRYTDYLVAGLQGTNLQKQPTTFAPYLVAAQVAGAEAGLALNEALTLKPFNATGLEQTFAYPVVDQLVQGGCLVFKVVNKQYVLAKGQSTAAINPAATVDDVQMQAVNETFVIEYGLNLVLNTFVGQPILPTTAASVQSAVFDYLKSIGTGPDALIFGYPSASQIQVTISGTVISVAAPASPTVAADFVTAMLSASVDTAAA